MTRPRPRRLGHLVMMVRDLQASARFYVDIVGLEVSDRIGDQMVFLRCGDEHHDLALAQLPADSPKFDDGPDTRRPGLEHFAYQLANLDEIESAAAFLKTEGVEIVRGIGKHGPGENVFLVFKDPDGNYVEFYCDMIQMDATTPHVARTWENNLDAFDQWHFERFLVPPPAWGPRTGDDEGNRNQ